MENTEKELQFERVEAEKAPEGVFVEDGALYDSNGKPVPADSFVSDSNIVEIPKKKFTNSILKDAKIPKGQVTVDEQGREVNSSLNTNNNAPIADSQKDILSEIMGADFVNAFNEKKDNTLINVRHVSGSSHPIDLPQ